MTAANSAVTEPRSATARQAGARRTDVRSAREGERTLDEVREHPAHLVAAHDDNEQSGEPDRGHAPRSQGFPAFDFAIEDARRAA